MTVKLVEVKVRGVEQWGEIYQSPDGRIDVYDPESHQWQGTIEEPDEEMEVKPIAKK